MIRIIIPSEHESPINPLAANLFKWNFYPFEVVSPRCDPQLQVSEQISDFTK